MMKDLLQVFEEKRTKMTLIFYGFRRSLRFALDFFRVEHYNMGTIR